MASSRPASPRSRRSTICSSSFSASSYVTSLAFSGSRPAEPGGSSPRPTWRARHSAASNNHGIPASGKGAEGGNRLFPPSYDASSERAVGDFDGDRVPARDRGGGTNQLAVVP